METHPPPQSELLSQLEQERRALSEARLALEKSKSEFARQREEEERALEEERARFAREQSEIVEIKQQLEGKKSSHDRLEREYKLRAQIEFQRFHEERRAREAGWERERKEIEERLKEREEAFRLQEEQSLRKLEEEKQRLEQLASSIERAARARESEIRSEEESLRHSRQNLAGIQNALAERERQASAASAAAERAQIEQDRRKLAQEAALARKRVEEQEEAFRTTVTLRDEMAAKEKTKLEAQKSAVEKCLSALQRRVEGEQAHIEERLAGERDQIASGFEDQLREQKRLAGEIEARHAAEIEAVRREIVEQEGLLAAKQAALEMEEQRIEQLGLIHQVNPEEFAAKIAAEEQRIEARRREIEAALDKLKRARGRRNMAIAAGVVIAALAASVAGYYVKGRLKALWDVPGKERWEALARERADTLSKKDWPTLLQWCAATDIVFEKDDALKPFYQAHRDEVRQTMVKSVMGMLDSKLAPLPEAEAERILANLDRFNTWNPPSEHTLLVAKIRVPLLLKKNVPVDALRSYADAVARSPGLTSSLKPELDQTLGALEQRVAMREEVGDTEAAIELLSRVQAAAKPGEDPLLEPDVRRRVARLSANISAASLSREGKPLRALATLTDYARNDSEFAAASNGEIQNLMLLVEKLPPNELLGAADVLTDAGLFWKLAKPFMLLANSGAGEDAKFDFYRKADDFGDPDARAFVGAYFLHDGQRNNMEENKRLGVAKLRSAAEAGSSEAMISMADAALSGALGNDRAAEALIWAGKAGAKGRPEAKFLTGQALVLQAEEKSRVASPEARDLYEKARLLLEEAGASNPKAWFFAAQAAFGSGNFAQMVESLTKGKNNRDPAATFMLAQCYLIGQKPLVQNISIGRQLVIEAAKGGWPEAIAWCKENKVPYETAPLRSTENSR